MSSEELYLQFRTRVNERGGYADRYLSPDVFVLLWNTEKDRWLEQSLSKKEDSQRIQDLQFLLEKRVPLTKSRDAVTEGVAKYEIPNVHQLGTAYIKSKKGDCKRTLVASPIKHPSLIPLYLQDELNRPSFEWEETFYDVAKDRMWVYVTDFEVLGVELDYWRTLKPIDLEGYERLDGTTSKTVNPEPLPDIYLMQILDRVILEFYRITPQQDGLQTGMHRIQTEEKEVF